MKDKIGNIFKVAYMPSLSAVMKAFIKQNVQAAFENEDAAQYNMEFILDALEEHNNSNHFLKEDLELIKYMVEEENIEYIEI